MIFQKSRSKRWIRLLENKYISLLLTFYTDRDGNVVIDDGRRERESKHFANFDAVAQLVRVRVDPFDPVAIAPLLHTMLLTYSKSYNFNCKSFSKLNSPVKL